MKSIIRWAVNSTPAMNVFMVVILILGIAAGATLRRETFPRFELEIILVTVPYPGASPDEIEEGICQKIEEAVRSIDGIKKVTSVAMENAGNVVIELRSDVEDVQKVLGEVESAVDRIPSFPDLAEDPEIQQVAMRRGAIKVAIVRSDESLGGNTGRSETDVKLTPREELQLREIAEGVRDDLLAIPSISLVDIEGAKEYQIDIEISEETLRRYGLTLQEVARRVRAENLELPGGKLKTDSSEILLRGKNKRVTGERIEEIPLVTKENGVVLTIGDLGTVSDDFVDTTAISRVNGKPGLVVAVQAADREDLIEMTDGVKEYVATNEAPPGYEFVTFDDQSTDVKDRLDLLRRNGAQGLLLVFIVLAAFLEFRLAFWVSLGIPVSLLGACAILWYFDQTLNMLSMFAFLMALGIVVDDAIVVGENIYAHRQMGKKALQAAIDGTVEVIPSVTASVTTTVIAFCPMFFVSGVMGKFMAVLPLAIIAMLVISLFESTFILPCHLKHASHNSKPLAQRTRANANHWPPLLRWTLGPIAILLAFLFDGLRTLFSPLTFVFGKLNAATTRLMNFLIDYTYKPILARTVRAPSIFLAFCFALLLFTFSFVTNRTVPWVFFPKLDAPQIQATVTYPDGTPAAQADAATRRIEQTILAINEDYENEYGSKLVKLVHRIVGPVASEDAGRGGNGAGGSHMGQVKVELVDNTQREITSQEVVKRWREQSGKFPGTESVTFGTQGKGPGGKAIEFKLLAKPGKMAELEEAVEKTKTKLAEFPGVFDISDDSRPGKWEYQMTVREKAKALGISQQALAATVRSSYYGEEVMRLQRGRHEVKLMVRYPAAERQKLSNFDDLRVDGPQGDKLPLDQLANVNVERSYSEVNRIDQKRSITITADVDSSEGNAQTIITDLRKNFVPQLLEDYPDLRVRWEGEAEQQKESMQSLVIGFAVALLAMFVLLTLQFNSYLQPAIIMGVIPFGIVGAVWGHFIMGLPLTLFSVLGLVALTGVIINDSIVLVDFINAKRKTGESMEAVLIEAGTRRFRPVLLTSATTVAGLLPILTETSFQAQLVIPMATSLAFGLLLGTFLVLLLVPTFYMLYYKLVGQPPLNVDEDEE